MEKIWYDSNRQRDDVMPNSAAVKILNGIAFVLVFMLVTGPVWGFIPWSMTPLGTPMGTIRFLIAAFLCHVGLLFWPFAIILFVNVLRQKRLTGLVHSALLIGVSMWQGWDCTQGVIWIWEQIGRWVLG